MRNRNFYSLLFAAAVCVVFAGVAESQSSRPAPGTVFPGSGEVHGRGAQGGSGQPSGVGAAARAPQMWHPVDLFPTRLGNTVGLQAFPAVTNYPGYGNINQPGLAPGAPTVYPNINNPGGPLLGTPPQPLPRYPHGGGHDGRPHGGGPVVYVPYYIYPGLNSPIFGSSSSTYSSSGSMTYSSSGSSGGGNTGYQSYDQAYPEERPSPVGSVQPTVFLDDKPKAEPSAQLPSSAEKPAEKSPPAPPKTKPVTLLAFRDGTIVGVTDYWLEKFTLIYLRSGLRTETPLEQLDLPKTVQLNRELGVPLELESR